MRARKLRFKYIDVTTNEFASGATFQFGTYNANNLWDLNAALTSTSAVGFAEWSPFFTHYRVDAVRCTIDLANTSTNYRWCGIMFIPPSSSGPANWPDLMASRANRHHKCVLLAPLGTTGAKRRLSLRAQMWNVVGDRKSYLNDSWTAPINGGPTNTVFLYIYCADMVNGTVLTVPTSFTTVLTVEATLFSPKTLFV